MTNEYEYILAMDAGGSFLKACIFCGKVPLTQTLSSVAVDSDGDLETVHEAYIRILSVMKAKADALRICIAGVCVDIPGPFDYAAGISRMQHKYTAIYGIPLRPWFCEVLGNQTKTVFLHDSHAFINGVAAETAYRNIAGVMLGTGFGFAMMKDGKALITEQGTPMISLYNRPYRKGIAEDVVSSRGIVATYASMAASSVKTPLPNAKEIGILAEHGDEIALRTYRDLGTAVGELVHDVLLEHQTEALYLGGQISRSFPIFGEPLKAVLADILTLQVIAPVKDLELVHLRGAARHWCMNREVV